MKEKDLAKKYKTVCIDDNNNLPTNIKTVPTIIDSSLSDILVGDKAFDYISNLQYFNFPSNNFNNWNNKIIPKPKIIPDKKAYDNKAMENNSEHFSNKEEMNKMIGLRRKQDLNFNQ
tara:strand:+ start:1384 stop:1734 length:351 start_codon:yes stop_codon:yes gene_type:complete